MLGGSLTAEPTLGLLMTPAIIAVSGAGAEPRRPVAFSAVLAVVGLAIVTASSLLSGFSGIFVLGCAAGFGLGVAVGYSRRQAIQAQERELELLERELDVEREHERSALLADRAALARDIHDVLAHSLGGLVIQLDAVEALLESGRVGGGDALAALDDLHRRALAAVTREALSNARRHAPGETVTLVLDRATPGILRARLSNAVPVSARSVSTAGVGGGHGLLGMRERIAELRDGSTLSAGETGGRFVVDVALVAGDA